MSEKFLGGHGGRGEQIHAQLMEGLRADLLKDENAQRALKVVEEEYARRMKIGRVLEKRDTEVVFPIANEDQKRRLEDAFSELGISPWIEDGLFVIDHRRDLETMAMLGVGVSPKELLTKRNPVDQYYSFPYPAIHKPESEKEVVEASRPTPVPPLEQEHAVAEEMRVHELGSDEAEYVDEMDDEVARIIGDFYAGLVEPEDPKFKKVFGDVPSLALFPRKYVWRGRKVFHARSGEEITAGERDAMFNRAQAGDAHAKQELIYMSTGLVLIVLERTKKRYPKADPDDLFQEGLIGLSRVIDIYESGEAAFSTVAVLWIEQRMRRFAYEHDFPMHMPQHTSSSRKILLKNPDDEVIRGKVKSRLTRTALGIDRLRRKFLTTTIMTSAQDMTDAEFASSLRMTDAERHVAEPEQDDEVQEKDMQEKVRRVLMTLTPREERTLRERFGFGSPDGEGKTLDEVGEGLGVTRERVRQIEAKALRRLKHPSRAKVLRDLFSDQTDD